MTYAKIALGSPTTDSLPTEQCIRISPSLTSNGLIMLSETGRIIGSYLCERYTETARLIKGVDKDIHINFHSFFQILIPLV